MSIEDRLRRIVTALPEQASVTLPVLLVKEWLETEADDPLADLTVADVAEQLGRSPVHHSRLDPAWGAEGVSAGQGVSRHAPRTDHVLPAAT